MNHRILMLSVGLELGGAEWQILHLCTGLKERGYEIKIVSMVEPGPLGDIARENGIEVCSLNIKRGVPDLRAIFRLKKIIQEYQPQILHSHMVHANILGRIVRLIVPVPIVISTAQNIDERGKLRELAYRFTDFLCDVTTQVSQAGVERYARIGAVPKEKIRFTPNCVDTKRFHPNAQMREQKRRELELGEKFAWIAVGRFEEQKDYPNMLYAFARALNENKNQILLLAGKGILKDKMEQLARELEIDQQVRFLGPRKDVPELMNAADAFLMSSGWEGMPLVLLEAAASGLPIVATDVGGNREVVLDEKSGFLVPSKNSQALAFAMQRLSQLSLEEQRKMGAEGFNSVQGRYSRDRVIDLWESIYAEFLAKKAESFSKKTETIQTDSSEKESNRV